MLAEEAPALRQAIGSLYEAFKEVPKPGSIEACPCCVDEKEVCVLLSKQLRELSPDDLSPYAAAAFLTVGDVPDYLYFLPRILDISSTNDFWYPDPEVTGRAIRNTVPGTWPGRRLQALDGFLHALIAQFLHRDDSGADIDAWICAIGRMGLDVGPFLAQVEQSPAHVLAYYLENAKRLIDRRLGNPFWERPNAAHDQIVDWFGSEAVGDILLAAYGQVKG